MFRRFRDTWLLWSQDTVTVLVTGFACVCLGNGNLVRVAAM